MAEVTGRFHVCNGELKNNVEFDDCFLKKTHYLYEIFRTVDGTPLFLEDHLERFEHSLRLSNLALPYPKDKIVWQINMLIRENDLKTGNIKMVFLPDEETKGFRYIMFVTPHYYPTTEQYMLGVPVSLFYGMRDKPNAKIMDSLLRSETDRNRLEENVYEALLVDNDGFITEGSRSNVFFIKGDQVITPPVEFILPGITRKHIIALCNELDITVKEQKVHKDEVPEMEGVFISGTSRKVLPVNKVDTHSFLVNHSVLNSLKEGFDKKVEQYLQNRRM